jgi:NAD(P)-dependent dehydrogenase (short-subunit alcohol dehydrogenase family)
MRQTMDVNFFGHVAMTKKCLPLLITKRNSRVINICSVAGSSMSAYSASKYALESFSDCLRREMIPWNLRVSIIEPGFMRTSIIQGHRQSFQDFWSTLSKDAQTHWGEEFLKQQYDIHKTSLFIKYAEDPMKVVRTLEHAVMNTNPRIRYRPGWQSSLIFFPLSMIPAWIVNLLLIKFNKSTLLPASVYKQLSD